MSQTLTNEQIQAALNTSDYTEQSKITLRAISELHSAFVAFSDSLSADKAQREELKATLATLQEEITQASEQVAQIKASLNSTQTQTLQTIYESIESAQESTAKRFNEELQKAIATLQATTNNIKNELNARYGIDSITGESSLRADISANSTRISSEESTNQAQASQIESLKEKNTEQESKISELESSLEALKERLNALETKEPTQETEETDEDTSEGTEGGQESSQLPS